MHHSLLQMEVKVCRSIEHAGGALSTANRGVPLPELLRRDPLAIVELQLRDEARFDEQRLHEVNIELHLAAGRNDVGHLTTISDESEKLAKRGQNKSELCAQKLCARIVQMDFYDHAKSMPHKVLSVNTKNRLLLTQNRSVERFLF